MYLYDEIDSRIVDDRVKQFRDQTRRFLAGKLSEDDFRALRLRNGLYIQRYAPMLRIAIPYGLLSTRQLRKLADISRKYDRAYGHFSTRQDRKSTRLNSSHGYISYAVFCLKKKKKN